MRTIAIAALVLVLAGCASGSAIVTGEKRAPIPADQVKIYATPPQGAEIVGVVQASSGSGIGEQARMDYVVAELKAQAGKIGANGIVLTGAGAQTGAAVVVPTGAGGFMGLPSNKQAAQGQAIFVRE
ncbi:hypothetical protein [Dokdonella ginsengisoli]|uniref:DUF4156 domain-containing protein n=1 Tax=Dokdonella ginsengisoli TaxID=363846 RepID=A0ABV9QR39_9GAMM